MALSATKIRNETIYLLIKKQSQFVVENFSYFVSNHFFSDAFSESLKRYHCEEMS